MRPDVYGRIAERARTQLGLVTIEQFAGAGGTRQERRTLVANGRWECRGRSVLADVAAPRAAHQHVLAAVLNAPGSVATGPAAAWLVGLPGFGPEPVHVLRKRGGNHRPKAFVLHETFWLPSSHTQCVRGVPCVSDARLAFELAPIVHPVRLRRIVDWLEANRGMPYDEMALTAAELWRKGKPGSAEMRLVVDERMPGYVPPATEIEAVFRDFCEARGLPVGIRQHNVGGAAWIGRVDVAFPPFKVIAELDSRRWHDTSTAFEDDRNRTNALVGDGWRVVRITWRMLHDEPEKVAALLRSLFVR